jgi:hypothetical protein
MSFAGCFAFGRRFTKLKAFGNALGDAGGLQPLVDPVHAVITFYGLAGCRIPLGGTPGACCDACLAADTECVIHEDNPVLGPFLHGPGRTGRHTPGILAVKAGHKNIRHAREIVDFLWTDRDNLGQPGPDGQIVFGFTVGLAAEAPDATFGILVNVVFAHTSSSEFLTFAIC